MRTGRRGLAALGITVWLAAAAAAAPAPGTAAPGLRLGFRLDYLTQTVSWSENGTKTTSPLSSELACAVLQLPLGAGSTASLLAGYTADKFNGFQFRQLPFSADLEAGRVGGLLLGAELDLGLIATGGLRIGAQGQVMAHLGRSESWDIPGLAVAGTLTGKPTWARALVGPVVALGAPGAVRPYLFPFFQYLWGTFDASESIQTLSGKETLHIKGESLFGVAAGLDVPLAGGVSLKAEAGLYPRGGRVDYSATIKTMFAL